MTKRIDESFSDYMAQLIKLNPTAVHAYIMELRSDHAKLIKRQQHVNAAIERLNTAKRYGTDMIDSTHLCIDDAIDLLNSGDS